MRIFIVATRISGLDGVSLEAGHWKKILEKMGHRVTLVAGQLDQPGILLPLLHFQTPKVVEIYDKVVSGKVDYKRIEKQIFSLAGEIEGQLREVFNGGKRADLLIVPNVLSLPMHFPLAVALTRIIEELKIPTITRHHDFWWERERFLKSTMFPFFKRWFPPRLKEIKHVTLNSFSKEQLKRRADLDSYVIGDCFDFSKKVKYDSFLRNWRDDFGLKDDDLVFLQPTRIVPRKRIELSIELVKRLKDPRAVLVIAGHAGDEGFEYEKRLRVIAKKKRVRCLFIGKCVNSHRRIEKTGINNKRKRIYTLWDCFVNCDFVTYPTQIEGFGNQFVETMYFKKPLILTPYPVYKKDIKPLGFKVTEIPNKITPKVVREVKKIIADRKKVVSDLEDNFQLGKKYFDYLTIEARLKIIFTRMKVN